MKPAYPTSAEGVRWPVASRPGTPGSRGAVSARPPRPAHRSPPTHTPIRRGLRADRPRTRVASNSMKQATSRSRTVPPGWDPSSGCSRTMLGRCGSRAATPPQRAPKRRQRRGGVWSLRKKTSPLRTKRAIQDGPHGYSRTPGRPRLWRRGLQLDTCRRCAVEGHALAAAAMHIDKVVLRSRWTDVRW